jgi:hypothetical protein
MIIGRSSRGIISKDALSEEASGGEGAIDLDLNVRDFAEFTLHAVGGTGDIVAAVAVGARAYLPD